MPPYPQKYLTAYYLLLETKLELSDLKNQTHKATDIIT